MKVILFILLIHEVTIGQVLSTFFGSNPLLEAAKKSSSIKKLDECFCELTGPVDVCCCDVETVDTLNSDTIHPIISKLVKQVYFRFFKVNFNKECPFWLDDGRCVLKDCHVEKCSKDELPLFLKNDNVTPDSIKTNTSHVTSCDPVSEEEKQLSTIIDDISDEQVEQFKEWARHDDDEDFCEFEDDFSDDASYVDLVINPERYTGYSGHSPHRIWSAIYNENCFRSDISSNLLGTQEMCLEKRAFFRLISGLHASINIHLSAQYIISGGSSNPKFGPNLNEFVRRFDTASTNGQGPGWLKNLYFAYLVVLRAITKAEETWKSIEFYTHDKEEFETKKKVLQLVEAAKNCGHYLFDESQMFSGDASDQLKEEFRLHFRNISRIMDCVGCDKCRLWGTLQIRGIGTALKILFNGRKTKQLHLSRSEVVSLFNVLGRLSESMQSLHLFKNMEIRNVHSSIPTDL